MADLTDPKDTVKIKLVTLARFVRSYVKNISNEVSDKIVIDNTIMCTSSGEAVFEIVNRKVDASLSEVLCRNMKPLANVLTSYNMNVSLIISKDVNRRELAFAYVDPELISTMSSGRFLNDPHFLTQVRSGIRLVRNRTTLLSKGNVSRGSLAGRGISKRPRRELRPSPVHEDLIGTTARC
jgi:hypothetical protein